MALRVSSRGIPSVQGVSALRRISNNRRAQLVDSLYALSLPSGNYYTTPNPGGEAGTATGFGIAILFYLPTLTGFAAFNSPMLDRSTTAPVAGYLSYFGSGPLTFAAVNTSAAFISSPARPFVASDVGRIHLHVGLHTGAGGFLRNYGDRREVGSGTPISGYTAASAPMLIGRSGNFSGNGSIAQILSTLTFQGTPSSADILALFDVVRNLGELPNSFTGATVTHRWSAKDAMRIQAQVPATLTDKITGAAGDLMTKTASPTIARIDPSIDGRTSYGIQSCSDTNYITTVSPGGIAGVSTGFWIACYFRLDDQLTNNYDILFARRTETPQGWQLYTASNNTILRWLVVNSAGNTEYTIAAGDIGVPLLAVAIFEGNGGKQRLYVRRAEQGTALTVGTYTPYAGPTRLGRHAVDLQTGVQAEHSTIFGGSGGHFVPTVAEIMQLFDDVANTGRIQGIPGKTDHLWDITADVLANGQETVPAVILDRVGTDHMTRIGVEIRANANAIRSVGPYSTTDGWQTALGTGIQGANSGFHVVLDIWLTKIPSTNECLVQCGAANATSGYFLQLLSTALTGTIASVANASTYTITSGDLNKRLRLLFQKTATVVQLWINGVQVGSDVAAASYTAPSSASMLVAQFTGTANGPRPFGSGYVEAVEGGNTILTAGEIATLNADLTVSPPVIAGKTQKRWIFEQDIAAINSALPARSVERISGGDDLVRFGAPLQLSQRTERPWSWETTPIMYGISGFNNSHYFNQVPGFAGDPIAFWVCWLGIIESQAVSSATRVMLAKRSSTNPGWQLYTNGTNSSFQCGIGNSTGAVTTTTSAIASGEVGKLFVLLMTFDGSKQHMHLRRAEVGTGSSALTGAYVDSAANLTLGKRSDGFAATSITTLGWSAGLGYVAISEYQALYDAIMAKERIQGIPGKTTTLIDVTLDVIEAGGVLPTTLKDRVGTANMGQGGNPVLAPQYARPWAA